MYNKECRFEIEKFFIELNKRRNNLPSELAIYNLLETFSYDSSIIGDSLSDIQDQAIDYDSFLSESNPCFTNRKKSKEISTDLELIDKTNSSNALKRYKHVDYKNAVSCEEKYKSIEFDDMIWLHFSIVSNKINEVANELSGILATNSISHWFRMPNVVGPDAILIGVYTKQQAELLLNLCKNNSIIQENITINNVFMPHRYGIGVVKETKKRDYTRHVSSLIYKYAKTSTEQELSFKNFCQYVNQLFSQERSNRTYQERFLDYQVALGICCIYAEKDYLDNLIHLPTNTYKKEEFEKYRVTFENGEYLYVDSSGNEITKDNYLVWLKLQAYNCIQRMYYEQNGELPKEDVDVSETMIGYLSSLIDKIMKGEPFYSTSNYRDTMVNDLYPCLVGYFSYVAKMTTEEEIKFIVNKVKTRMVNKLQVSGDNKNFYQIGDKTIQSTIPPIKVDNILVGIEYLDYENNYCNIFIYKNDNVKGYLGIFLDVDKEKIWEETETECSLYRAKIARTLCDFETLKKETITRGVHEGIWIDLGSATYTAETVVESKK